MNRGLRDLWGGLLGAAMAWVRSAEDLRPRSGHRGPRRFYTARQWQRLQRRRRMAAASRRINRRRARPGLRPSVRYGRRGGR